MADLQTEEHSGDEEISAQRRVPLAVIVGPIADGTLHDAHTLSGLATIAGERVVM